MAYQTAVFVHILAAITWIGGTLFLAMVVVPVVRGGVEPQRSARLLSEMGRKFRPVAWSSIALLVGSGLYVALDHWKVAPSEFFGGDSRFVQVLQVKVGLVAIAIVLSFIHDFVLGPRLTRSLQAANAGGPPPAGVAKLRKATVWLARVNLLLLLAIVALAVTLIRG